MLLTQNYSHSPNKITYLPKTFSNLNFGKKLNTVELEKDIVCLSNNVFPMKKATESFKNFNFHSFFDYIIDFKISEHKPIEIFEKTKDGKKPVTAFMTTINYVDDSKDHKTGLFVFSKEGKILGNIEHLNPKDSKDNSDLKTKNLGKYLRLQFLNASYFDNYAGIGTALIEEAKAKSKLFGCEGQLEVFASNYLDNSSRGFPNQFYAKKGFINIEHPNMPKEKFDEFGCCYLYLLNEQNKKRLL